MLIKDMLSLLTSGMSVSDRLDVKEYILVSTAMTLHTTPHAITLLSRQSEDVQLKVSILMLEVCRMSVPQLRSSESPSIQRIETGLYDQEEVKLLAARIQDNKRVLNIFEYNVNDLIRKM